VSLFKRALWQPKQKLGLERIEFAPDPVPPAPSYGQLPPPGPGWEQCRAGNGLGLWLHRARDADDAISVWQQWRDQHDSTGRWPILVDETFWDAIAEPGLAVADPAAGGAEWLTRALYGGSEPLADRVPRGTLSWLGTRPKPRPTNALGTSDVVLVPAAAPWLVPEVLGWTGAGKWDINGAQHTLVLRRWAARYGAEVLGLGDDDLYLWVSRPPASKIDAWLAAVEMVAYCPETVNVQDDVTLEDQVELMTASTWTVWFDLTEDDEDDAEDE
jgi:hypothetical protein